MKKNQIISNVTAFVLMGAAAAMIIYSLATQKDPKAYATFVVVAVTNLLALICGIIYTAKGSTKGAGTWLRAFECLAGAALLASVARGALTGESAAVIVLTTLSFGLLCILCFAENLGKKRSYCLGACLVVAEVIKTILSLSGRIKIGKAVNMTSRLIIVIVLVLLLVHKYHDKDSRGTT